MPPDLVNELQILSAPFRGPIEGVGVPQIRPIGNFRRRGNYSRANSTLKSKRNHRARWHDALGSANLWPTRVFSRRPAPIGSYPEYLEEATSCQRFSIIPREHLVRPTFGTRGHLSS
jgi:hypothetical protein